MLKNSSCKPSNRCLLTTVLLLVATISLVVGYKYGVRNERNANFGNSPVHYIESLPPVLTERVKPSATVTIYGAESFEVNCTDGVVLTVESKPAKREFIDNPIKLQYQETMPPPAPIEPEPVPALPDPTPVLPEPAPYK